MRSYAFLNDNRLCLYLVGRATTSVVCVSPLYGPGGRRQRKIYSEVIVNLVQHTSVGYQTRMELDIYDIDKQKKN